MAKYYRAELIDEPDDTVVHRNSIGGHPILPVDQDWPVCGHTGEKMVLFFQFDLDPKFKLPFPPHSHLSVFMSPKVDTIPEIGFCPHGQPLPSQFWEKYGSHMKVILSQGEKNEQILKCDPYLKYKRIEFMKYQFMPKDEVDMPEDDYILVGGSPLWMQDPYLPTGPNGEKFTLICQTSDYYIFEKRESAPKQANKNRSYYRLFLGCNTYIFGSPELRHPQALWVSCQSD